MLFKNLSLPWSFTIFSRTKDVQVFFFLPRMTILGKSVSVLKSVETLVRQYTYQKRQSKINFLAILCCTSLGVWRIKGIPWIEKTASGKLGKLEVLSEILEKLILFKKWNVFLYFHWSKYSVISLAFLDLVIFQEERS